MEPRGEVLTVDKLLELLACQKWGDHHTMSGQAVLLVNVHLPFPLPLLVRTLADPDGAAVTYTIRWGIGGVPDQLVAQPPGSYVITCETLQVEGERGNVVPGVATRQAATAGITTAAPTLAPV